MVNKEESMAVMKESQEAEEVGMGQSEVTGMGSNMNQRVKLTMGSSYPS